MGARGTNQQITMKYKIKIEKARELADSKYPVYDDLYEQIVEDINVENVIKAVNGFV